MVKMAASHFHHQSAAQWFSVAPSFSIVYIRSVGSRRSKAFVHLHFIGCSPRCTETFQIDRRWLLFRPADSGNVGMLKSWSRSHRITRNGQQTSIALKNPEASEWILKHADNERPTTDVNSKANANSLEESQSLPKESRNIRRERRFQGSLLLVWLLIRSLSASRQNGMTTPRPKAGMGYELLFFSLSLSLFFCFVLFIYLLLLFWFFFWFHSTPRGGRGRGRGGRGLSKIQFNAIDLFLMQSTIEAWFQCADDFLTNHL